MSFFVVLLKKKLRLRPPRSPSSSNDIFSSRFSGLENNRLRGSLPVWRSLPEFPEAVARYHAARGRAMPFEDDG